MSQFNKITYFLLAVEKPCLAEFVDLVLDVPRSSSLYDFSLLLAAFALDSMVECPVDSFKAYAELEDSDYLRESIGDHEDLGYKCFSGTVLLDGYDNSEHEVFAGLKLDGGAGIFFFYKSDKPDKD